MDTSVLPLVAFILTAIGWISREIWRWRKAKRLATEDATKTLTQKKKLLEEMISKSEDTSSKETLTTQLEEVNAALLGLYAQRLRHTLKEAGLPPEEMLIADGQRQLRPQETTYLKGLIEELKTLPQFPSTHDLLVQGSAYYLLQRYEDAENMYNKILEITPHDQSVLKYRGATYFRLKKYKKALNDFNRALELKADDPVALHDRGMTLRNLGGYEEALADFNRSLELRPDNPHTLYNLACLFSLQGKTDDALSYLKKAIDKDEKYREMAKTDKDFDNIRDDPRFKKLLESD